MGSWDDRGGHTHCSHMLAALQVRRKGKSTLIHFNNSPWSSLQRCDPLKPIICGYEFNE
jgi:hypothetical protein